MEKRVIKNHTLGEGISDYTCRYDWPADCAIQCGGKGVVIGSKNRPGYVTSFFEAFPSRNFIRGEGDTVYRAEDDAWQKYQIIINCPEHHFINDEKNKRDAVCQCCGFVVKEYYPPENTCHSCGKEHVSLKLHNQFFCIEHFIQQAKKIDYEITPELIIDFKKEVFEDIQSSQGKEKNLIDMMLGKNDSKIKSYEDISHDDYRVEMKISNLKNIELMKNMLIATQMANLLDIFSSEYKLIDWINDQKSHLSGIATKKTVEIFNAVINNMKENKNIDSSFNSREYFNDTEAMFEKIEHKVKLMLFISHMITQYNIDEHYIYRPLYGVSKSQVMEMIQTDIMISIFNHRNI